MVPRSMPPNLLLIYAGMPFNRPLDMGLLLGHARLFHIAPSSMPFSLPFSSSSVPLNVPLSVPLSEPLNFRSVPLNAPLNFFPVELLRRYDNKLKGRAKGRAP